MLCSSEMYKQWHREITELNCSEGRKKDLFQLKLQRPSGVGVGCGDGGRILTTLELIKCICCIDSSL